MIILIKLLKHNTIFNYYENMLPIKNKFLKVINKICT